MQLYYRDPMSLFILLMLFILLAGVNISDKKLSYRRETARQLRCACISIDPSAAEFGRCRRKRLSRKSAEKKSASLPPPKMRKFGVLRIGDRLLKLFIV